MAGMAERGGKGLQYASGPSQRMRVSTQTRGGKYARLDKASRRQKRRKSGSSPGGGWSLPSLKKRPANSKEG